MKETTDKGNITMEGFKCAWLNDHLNADGITDCKAFRSALILKKHEETRIELTLCEQLMKYSMAQESLQPIYAAGPSWLLSRAAFALGSTVQRRTVAS